MFKVLLQLNLLKISTVTTNNTLIALNLLLECIQNDKIRGRIIPAKHSKNCRVSRTCGSCSLDATIPCHYNKDYIFEYRTRHLKRLELGAEVGLSFGRGQGITRNIDEYQSLRDFLKLLSGFSQSFVLVSRLVNQSISEPSNQVHLSIRTSLNVYVKITFQMNQKLK